MRRFNYTGRRKLSRSAIAITLHSSGDGGLTFDAQMDLSDLKEIPGDARLYVEAYGGPKLERFDFGPANDRRSPTRIPLLQFRADENVLFRVKLVQMVEASGRILAMATQLKPVRPDEGAQRSMLPVSVVPLDGVVYRVDFSDDEPPTLLLNEALDLSHDTGMKGVARSPVFISLVYPSAIRDILARILLVERWNPDEDDESSWKKQWIEFANRLYPAPVPELSEDEDISPIAEWIDGAVAEVGRYLGSVDRFGEWLGEQK